MGSTGPIILGPFNNDANFFESVGSFFVMIWHTLVNSYEELIMFIRLIFNTFSAFEYLSHYLPNILAIGFFCFFAISILKLFIKKGH